MKKLILNTALASLMAVSATTFAATTGAVDNTNSMPMPNTTHMKGQVAGKMMRDQMEVDAKRLNLTTEQRTKIKELMKESKMELDKKIRNELDDKQKVEFDKIQAEHKAAWEKHKSTN